VLILKSADIDSSTPSMTDSSYIYIHKTTNRASSLPSTGARDHLKMAKRLSCNWNTETKIEGQETNTNRITNAVSAVFRKRLGLHYRRTGTPSMRSPESIFRRKENDEHYRSLTDSLID